jgi:DNA-binding HxlR family transcriptional regulator
MVQGLERVGIVQRRMLPPPASAQVYELTPWGYEAEVVLQDLGCWATRSAAARSDAALVGRIDHDVVAHDVFA